MSHIDDFMSNVDDTMKPIAKAVIATVDSHKKYDTALNWGQLTFAIDDDFDHWICAVSATKKQVNLKFHFGSLLHDKNQTLTPEASRFIRKIEITDESDIPKGDIASLLDQADKKLPLFQRALERNQSERVKSVFQTLVVICLPNSF